MPCPSSPFYLTETITPETFSDVAATKRRLFQISTTLHRHTRGTSLMQYVKCMSSYVFSVSLTYVSRLRKHNETREMFCGHLYFFPSTCSVVLLLTQPYSLSPDIPGSWRMRNSLS
jgi:hypothetical protein